MLSSVRVITMRMDNKDPRIIYKSYWDWLFNYKEHNIFIISIGVGYIYYLTTTAEVLT